MLFFLHCIDKPGHQRVRADNRGAHLEYLGGFINHVFCAGPTLTDDGEGMTGSVLIIEFEDRAAAQAFADNDPYAKAGLFDSVALHPWKKVLPKDP